MRPIVRDAGERFDRQTHAYAEYRVFSGLAGEQVPLSSAVVLLDESTAGHGGALCWITVELADGETLHASATEHHPYAAIDRAAALITAAIRSHQARAFRCESPVAD